MTASPGHVIAGCFALAAFAVAVLAGLAGGHGAAPILLRALVSMVVCYPVGIVIGMVVRRAIEDQRRPRAAGGAGPPVPAVEPDQTARIAKPVQDARSA